MTATALWSSMAVPQKSIEYGGDLVFVNAVLDQAEPVIGDRDDNVRISLVVISSMLIPASYSVWNIRPA